MMRTLATLASALLLCAPLAAESSQDFENSLAPGSFHLFNHPDGGWQGVGDLDGDGVYETDVAYGLILSGWVPGVKHLVFDFNHPQSTMKLTWKPSSNELRIHGQAFAWASDQYGTKSGSDFLYRPLDSGWATIDMTYTGLVTEEGDSFGDYRDLQTFAGSEPAYGIVTMPNGDKYGMTGMARDTDGLIFQFGDGPEVMNRAAGHEAYFENLSGMFSKNSGAEGGSAVDPKDEPPTPTAENGAAASWVRGGAKDGESTDEGGEVIVPPTVGKPSDFIFGAKGRAAGKPN